MFLRCMANRQLKGWQGSLLMLLLVRRPVLPDHETTRFWHDHGHCLHVPLHAVHLGPALALCPAGRFRLVIMAVLLAWFFYFSDYQKNRIITFLYPGHDPSASYNLLQSKLAIASGGLIGSQRGTPVHVPVKEADFILHGGVRTHGLHRDDRPAAPDLLFSGPLPVCRVQSPASHVRRRR